MRDILKLVIVMIVALVLSGCGQDSSIQYTKAPYALCSTTQGVDGARITCPDGSSSFVSNGVVGGVGPTGNAGPAGAPGTVVVPVQLCPGVAPTYASVFPEYALCIGNVLYGTFNNNTSYQYLAALPDGAYSSNGQGAACSFVIAGCSLTY